MDADVLVVGAGIGGLSAAARLLDLGLAVEVAERAPQLRAAGAGIMLHPNALALLGPLHPRVLSSGAVIARQVATDPDGTSTVVEWSEVWGGRLPVAVHRQRLAELMLARLPAGTVRWSAAPVALRQDAQSVLVTFAGGGTRRYRAVVGADGVHSWVRQAVDPAAGPHPLSQTYWRTTVPAAGAFDLPEWRVWRGAGRFFGVMPIGAGRAHVFLQSPVDRSRVTPPERAKAELVELGRQMGGPPARLAAAAAGGGEVQVRSAVRLAVQRWAAGRVALVGDAAHAVSPATTQGGALAVEDAAVLADEIRRHGLGPRALSAYEARRRPRLARFVRLSELHVALTGSLGRAAAGAPEPAPARRGARAPDPDAARWFRRLYAPLREAA